MMKIKNHDLNDDLIIEIGRFSVLWNYFEQCQCSNRCNSRKIKTVCQNICVANDKKNQLAKALNNRRIFFNYSIHEYVQDGLYLKGAWQNNTEEDKKLINAFLEQIDGNSTVGCFLAIYRIRNNLMHGLKQIEDLNNQLDLFRAVNEVLESVKEV